MLALFHGGETVQWITLLRTGTTAIVRNLEIAVSATPELQKGDVARAVLCMDVRYEGGTNVFGAPEPDPVITNNSALIQTTGTNTTGTAYLGLLCVLVEWHRADPPDEQERLRNALVQTFQNNRNPFVEHPEWADTLFNAECPRPDALFQDGFD